MIESTTNRTSGNGFARLVLCFHGIGSPRRPLEPGEAPCWLEPAQFEEMLDEIVGSPDVLITFDDGNKSDVDVAMPLLLGRGLTSTIFVIARRIGESGSLTAGDLRELIENGMSIGTHGYGHRPWRRLDSSACREELVQAREMIEAASGQRVTEAACPFGAYDRKSLHALKRFGYERVYTVDGGYADPQAWLQTRHSIHSLDNGGTVRGLIRGSRRRSLPQPVRTAKLLVKRWR
jgi:peptidoglycan/xylan/chitin deacetylase (PgdA/CDA1 family)